MKIKIIIIYSFYIFINPNLKAQILDLSNTCQVKHKKPYDKCPFVSQWLISKPNTEIHLYFPEIFEPNSKLPLQYNFQINWGDGSQEVKIASNEDILLKKNRFLSHNYKDKGYYQVIISGLVPSIEVCNHPNNFLEKKRNRDDENFIENMTLEHVLDFGNLDWKYLSYSFSNCLMLQSFTGGMTSSVVNMTAMFADDIRLTEIDLSSFSTSQVKYMDSMFARSYELSRLDLKNFNTSRVLSMNGMFYGTKSLNELNISSFETDSVMSMISMFEGAESLRELNLKHFNTKEVTSMDSMFKKMFRLNKLDISNFDTSKVYDMGEMFSGLFSLETLNLSHFKTDNLKYMPFMFADTPLKSLNISSFNTKNVEDMSYLFGRSALYDLDYIKNCSQLKEVDLSHFNFSSARNIRGLVAGLIIIYGSDHLNVLDLSSLDLTKFKPPQLSADELKYYSKKSSGITKYFSNIKLIKSPAKIYCHKNSKAILDASCSYKFTTGDGDSIGGACNCIVKP